MPKAESDLALLDAASVASYVKYRLRQQINQAGTAVAQSFSPAQIDFVALAFEFSALRLPANMSLELLTTYAELPAGQRERVTFNDYASVWDYGDDRPQPKQPIERALKEVSLSTSDFSTVTLPDIRVKAST
jgi:hypothetical protein